MSRSTSTPRELVLRRFGDSITCTAPVQSNHSDCSRLSLEFPLRVLPMILSGTSGHRAWQCTRSATAILPVLAVILLVSGCQGLPHSRGTLTPRGQSPGYARDIQQNFDEFPASDVPLRQGPDGPGLLDAEDASQDSLVTDNTLVNIRIEGNDTIETGAIMAYVKSQVGRPPNERQINRVWF
jgi:hypothetical protein